MIRGKTSKKPDSGTLKKALRVASVATSAGNKLPASLPRSSTSSNFIKI